MLSTSSSDAFFGGGDDAASGGGAALVGDALSVALRKGDDVKLRQTPVTVKLLSGEQLTISDLPPEAFVHHLRNRLEKTRPTPPGSCYKLLLGDHLLPNNALLPEESSTPITAAVQKGICGSWMRSLLAEDLSIEDEKFERARCLAYSLALDCLILGNDDCNSNVVAVDLTTLCQRDVNGLDTLETPFPSGHLAIGALPISSVDTPDKAVTCMSQSRVRKKPAGVKRARVEPNSDAVELVFLSEQRYDHVNVSEVHAVPAAKSAEPSSARLTRRGSIGSEGRDHMIAPSFLCFDPAADELWVVRDEGGDQNARFICVVQASTGKKMGLIPHSAMSSDGPSDDYPQRWWAFGGLALSRDEAFIATGPKVKVFDRAERVQVKVPPEYVGQEVGLGFAFRQELKLAEPVQHLLWFNDQLVACCANAIYFLDQNGEELHRIEAKDKSPAICAAVCERSGRPAELAVLDGRGNVHFYE